jgi:hypothetical protein
MTVALSVAASDGSKHFQCGGVVVACAGNKHAGYRISMVFTHLSPQAQTRLDSMARSELGTS